MELVLDIYKGEAIHLNNFAQNDALATTPNTGHISNHLKIKVDES